MRTRGQKLKIYCLAFIPHLSGSASVLVSLLWTEAPSSPSHHLTFHKSPLFDTAFVSVPSKEILLQAKHNNSTFQKKMKKKNIMSSTLKLYNPFYSYFPPIHVSSQIPSRLITLFFKSKKKNSLFKKK